MTSSELSFRLLPEQKAAQTAHTIGVTIETESRYSGEDLSDAKVEASLTVSGENVGTLGPKSGASGEAFNIDFTYRFSEEGQYTIRVNASIEYPLIGVEETLQIEDTIRIGDKPETTRQDLLSNRDTSDGAGYTNAYDNRGSTIITDIETDSDVSLGFDEIDFSPFDNPNIGIDSSARFAVHEILGGTTVRQKIGEEPTQVSIDGVCTEEVAIKVDQLKESYLVKLLSDRVPDGINGQIASTSTDPLEDGGAADMDRGDFLYEFSINLVEVME